MPRPITVPLFPVLAVLRGLSVTIVPLVAEAPVVIEAVVPAAVVPVPVVPVFVVPAAVVVTVPVVRAAPVVTGAVVPEEPVVTGVPVVASGVPVVAGAEPVVAAAEKNEEKWNKAQSRLATHKSRTSDTGGSLTNFPYGCAISEVACVLTL